MLQQAGERAGAEDDGALLIAGADAVKQGLGERGDVFAALAQRRNGEADGGEAEGEVGQQAVPWPAIWRSGVCEEARRTARPGRTVLEGLENAEQQALSGRGEQVDAVEIGEAGEGGGIGVGGQPLAGVAALERASRRAASG